MIDCSLNPRCIPKAERVEIKNESKSKLKIKIEDDFKSRQIDVKPDRSKLMKMEVKCGKSLKMKNEENVDQKPDIQTITVQKNEVKEKLVVKAEYNPLINLKIKKYVKKEEVNEKRLIKKEKDDEGDSTGSIPEGPVDTRQKRVKNIEMESVRNAASSSIDLIDSDDEVSQPSFT